MRFGLSACFFHADPKRPVFKGKVIQYAEQSIAHWAAQRGDLVYLIPSPASQEQSALHLKKLKLSQYAEDLDGLILQGGSDVCPRSYGQEPLKPEWNGDRVRDLYEMALVREFVKRKKPVLGICRGLQLLNVYFGGTLYQDIEMQVPGALNHRNWDIYDANCHSVEVQPGNLLAGKAKAAFQVKTNSVHHQAIHQLGKGLEPLAYSVPDRLIEAIRHKKEHWVVGVQWHPEFHDPKDPSFWSGLPLLDEFRKAAQRKPRTQKK